MKKRNFNYSAAYAIWTPKVLLRRYFFTDSFLVFFLKLIFYTSYLSNAIQYHISRTDYSTWHRLLILDNQTKMGGGSKPLKLLHVFCFNQIYIILIIASLLLCSGYFKTPYLGYSCIYVESHYIINEMIFFSLKLLKWYTNFFNAIFTNNQKLLCLYLFFKI